MQSFYKKHQWVNLKQNDFEEVHFNPATIKTISPLKIMDNKPHLATLKQFLIPYSTSLLGPLLAQSPEWTLAWYSAIGLYGVYMEYNQDKVNDFIEFIQQNPGVFAASIVETEEFREAFIITMDSFFKQRGSERRKIIKRIFLDYSKNPSADFDLEKLYAKLNLLSGAEILVLRYVANHQIPRIVDKWKKLYETSPSPRRETLDQFISGILNRGTDIAQTGFDIKELFAIGFSKIHSEQPIEDSVKDLLTEDEQFLLREPEPDLYQILDSLASLGIFTKVYSSAIGGGSISYDTNKFGLRFIDFLKA